MLKYNSIYSDIYSELTLKVQLVFNKYTLDTKSFKLNYCKTSTQIDHMQCIDLYYIFYFVTIIKIKNKSTTSTLNKEGYQNPLYNALNSCS